MWCSRTEVTARAFWSKVGDSFEAMLRRIETVSQLSEAQAFWPRPSGWASARAIDLP
jgi:ferric iron reductase protein FhuF